MDATAQLCRRCLCQNLDRLSISLARARVQTGSPPSPQSPTAFTISSFGSAAEGTKAIVRERVIVNGSYDRQLWKSSGEETNRLPAIGKSSGAPGFIPSKIQPEPAKR